MSRRPSARFDHPFLRRRLAGAVSGAATKPPVVRKAAGRFRRTKAHYWHHQRKGAREAGNRYPSFAQIPGPWRVAKLSAGIRSRTLGRPRTLELIAAFFEWLATRPKVLLTHSGTARLLVEVISVVIVFATFWSFWNEFDSRRESQFNNAWQLIAARNDPVGNIGVVRALNFLRANGIQDFTQLRLPNAYLPGLDLPDSTLNDADLQGAFLRFANLRGAQMPRAKLRAADLSGADLRGANLRSADLTDASLHGADLADANLSAAQVCGTDFVETVIVDVDWGGSGPPQCADVSAAIQYYSDPLFDFGSLDVVIPSDDVDDNAELTDPQP